MRWACAPPRIRRTCWTASVGIGGELYSQAATVDLWQFFLSCHSERSEESAFIRGLEKTDSLLRTDLILFLVRLHKLFHALHVDVGEVDHVAALLDQLARVVERPAQSAQHGQSHHGRTVDAGGTVDENFTQGVILVEGFPG